MLSDLEIAQAATLKPIREIAADLGLSEDDIEYYGKYKAKILLDVLEKFRDRPSAKYIVITAITPTPLGEGKTTTTVGLGQGLNRIGKKAIITIRQPSLGPVFGIKGGAAGGGYSQVVPMEDFNLHLTGDNNAVGLAHNLLATFLDNHLQHGNHLGLDVRSITFRRVIDLSDRALRNVVVGLGGREDGVPRETGFDITAASEVMAILALTTSLTDLRERLGRIVVGTTRDGTAITAEDLKAAGAMAVLLKDAIKPNLLQTLENTPAIVHAGPFGNIAHGNSSVLGDQVAAKLAEYVVTESGFGADLGFEKCVNIKCRVSGLVPSVAVIVCTIRALKMHSGKFRVVAGRPLDPGLTQEDLAAVEAGIGNLVKQIENVRLVGIPAVVAINRFPYDSPAEFELVQRYSREAGALDAVVANHFEQGGQGAEDLARAVVEAAEQPNDFRFLYPLEAGIKEKIEIIAKQVYGAAAVTYLPAADRAIRLYDRLGYSRLPICMAKTHLSLSTDGGAKGRPTGFSVPIRDVRLSAGAGFLYPLVGDMRTMPGLPSKPAGEQVDIDPDGTIHGLF